MINLHNAENEKEAEMQIGTPTDVKHVAHIGWDGGSVNHNPPSWVFNLIFNNFLVYSITLTNKSLS